MRRMDRAESEVLVPASPEETWEAITDPDQLGEWLAEDAEVELRPGGDLRIGLDDGERSGFVEEVDEPRRLVFWWAPTRTSRAAWRSSSSRSPRAPASG